MAEYTLDGTTLTSSPIQGSPGTNVFQAWYRGGWFAKPGEQTIEITVDPQNVLQDPILQDNSTSITFTPVAPSLAEKFVWPLDGVPMQDSVITNYVDVAFANDQISDYSGRSFTYDGHRGLDIGLPNFQSMDDGRGVYAVADGVVTQMQDGNFDRQTTLEDNPANYVDIDHGNGWTTRYFHFAEDTITVKVGQHVTTGQLLGLAGSSGYSTGPHLHFEVHHNGSVVETSYAPDLYWLSPLAHQATVPPSVMSSGFSNYEPSDDALEGPLTNISFPADYVGNVYFWYRLTYTLAGDQFQLRWYRPDGTLANTQSASVGEVITDPFHRWGTQLNWSANPGTWHVELLINGVTRAEQSFDIGGDGSAIIRVSTDDTYIVNGRTTPIDFGSTPLGTPVQKVFTIANSGYTDLNLFIPLIPTGFRLVGDLQGTIAPGTSADYTLEMDAGPAGAFYGVVGERFGEVVFPTNDPTAPLFRCNIRGTVVGNASLGAAVLGNLGPAAVNVPGGVATRIYDQAVVASPGPTSFTGGSLRISPLSGAVPTDELGIQNQGTGSGQISVSNSVVSYEGQPIGTISGGTTWYLPLIVTFDSLTAPADLPAITALLRAVTYRCTTTDTDRLRRSISLTLTDEAGNVSNEVIRTVVLDTRRSSISGRSLFRRQQGRPVEPQ